MREIGDELERAVEEAKAQERRAQITLGLALVFVAAVVLARIAFWVRNGCP